MIDENKMIDGLTKAATQIAGLVMFFIFAAAATATDPFFRKNMGERYFTPIRAILSAAGWLALFFAAKSFSVGIDYYGNSTKPNRLVMVVGALILLAYVALSIVNLQTIRQRRSVGLLWHSKSRGESILGNENATRDFIIEAGVVILLNYVSLLYASFFLLSRLLGYAADAIAQATFYNRYLDIQDAKIEAEYMEIALRDGLAPGKTVGFDRRLPGGFTTNQRATIARIVAGGPVAAPAKTESAKTTSSGEQARPTVSVVTASSP